MGAVDAIGCTKINVISCCSANWEILLLHFNAAVIKHIISLSLFNGAQVATLHKTMTAFVVHFARGTGYVKPAQS